jgi:hypothetical protein
LEAFNYIKSKYPEEGEARVEFVTKMLEAT